MRNIKRWIVLALSLVMLVNLACVGTAAGNESPVRLYVSPAVESDSPFMVQVIASERDTVADGKLVVTYDAESLTYVGTETGAAWHNGEAVTLSVNASKGQIILAFASAEAANAGTVFSLTFQPKGTGNSFITLDSGSYISGVDAAVSDRVTVVASDACVNVTLNAGDHGTFADGTAETTITALDGAALSADMLPPVFTHAGCTLTGWIVGDTVYSLEELDIPASEGMTLTAQYLDACDGGANCPSRHFNDLDSLFPEAHNAVDFMVANGYMNGMSQTMFGPHVDLNRAMMVTILYRIAGNPAVSGTHTFVDVPDGVFYTDAVVWAYENGITTGLDATHFAPVKSLSRQELVTFLHRFAAYMGYDVTATTELSAYTDASVIQPYAVEAFQWAVAEGIIKGTTETTLSPEATTTRAQVSLMVYRLLPDQD